MSPVSFVDMILAYADRLKFRNLFLVVLGLFVADLFLPDVIPLIDEIILGLIAIILANWKKERKQDESGGELIEGKVVDREDTKNES